MKVELQLRRPHYQPPGHVMVPIKRSLPFVRSTHGNRGAYVHRVRMATSYYRDGRYSHTAFQAWCGTGIGSAGFELLEVAPPGAPVCATCEGRAVGAGQVPGARPPLLFRPGSC